jgi:hypothetical protein
LQCSVLVPPMIVTLCYGTSTLHCKGLAAYLHQCMEQISDTKILHDNDNYQQALSQYSYISYLSTQHVPGTTSIKDDLSQFFPNS